VVSINSSSDPTALPFFEVSLVSPRVLTTPRSTLGSAFPFRYAVTTKSFETRPDYLVSAKGTSCERGFRATLSFLSFFSVSTTTLSNNCPSAAFPCCSATNRSVVYEARLEQNTDTLIRVHIHIEKFVLLRSGRTTAAMSSALRVPGG